MSLSPEANRRSPQTVSGGSISVDKSDTNFTHRKLAEQALIESERRFRSFVEATAAVIWRTNRNGEVDESIPSWNAFTGQTAEQAAGFGWTNAIHPDDRASVFQAWQKASAAKAVYEVEYRLKIHTGEWRDVLARGVPILDNAGNILEYIGTCIDITERKSAERAVREAEERYRQQFTELEAIYHTAPLGLCVLDTELRFRRINKRLAEINGVSVEDHIGKTVAEIVPNIAPQAEQALLDVLKTGEPLHVELRGELPTRPGEIGIWDEQWYPLRDSTGKIIGIGVVAEDVTERRRMEDDLRESEQRFRQLGENIPQLAWMANPDGSIFWYNKRWFDYTGTNLEQMQGWGWRTVHHPDHIEHVTKKFKAAMESGQQWEDTFPLRAKDGQYRWFLSRAFPIRDANGRIIRWFGTNTDITELRAAQIKLSEREAVLSTVTNEARVGLVMVDHERRYLFANQTYADILGLADTNILGKSVGEVLANVYDQISPHLDRAFKGERVSYELHLPRHPKTGQERFYEVVYEPRLTKNPEETYVVVVIVDITERKFAQQTLERTVAERTTELRDTNQQLESFVYSIAHDLRAPLRAMQGYSEILIDNTAGKIDETDHRFLERIRGSSEYMDHMIMDLLAFGRAAQGEMELTRVDLQKVWEAAVYQCSQQIEQTHATLDVIVPLLPVRAHEPTLTQVLANLLSNAIKFVEPGKTPHVKFCCEDTGHGIRLWLEDNGIGIDPIYHERIFRVFERLEGAKYAGTGIGLSIVRKGVERMNGHIGVQSELGKGSRFWIDLPKP